MVLKIDNFEILINTNNSVIPLHFYFIFLFPYYLSFFGNICAQVHIIHYKYFWQKIVQRKVTKNLLDIGSSPYFTSNIKRIWTNLLSSIFPEIIRETKSFVIISRGIEVKEFA